jgi:uncharacterized membrane protein/DNA-directed RNA polymerase subunit RPC12/RpoP
MPIEFRCTQCSKLLQTPDETAGKHAKCPVCGSIVLIPTPGLASPGPAAGGVGEGAPPIPPGDTSSPFAPGPQPPSGPEAINPYQSPTAFGPMPQAPAPPGEIHPTPIDVGDVFSRTWTIFKQQWGMVWLGVLIVMGINWAAAMALMVLNFTVMMLTHNPDLAEVVNITGNLASYVLSIWLTLGQCAYFLKIARGQPPDLTTIFSGGPKLLTAILAYILFILIVIGGFLLLIIPGIIFALMFSQFLYLIVDRNVGVMDSLNLSKEITRGNKATLFAIGLLLGLLFVAAIIPCLLGLLVWIPFSSLMPAVIYLLMIGQPTADQMQAGVGR